MGWTYLFFRGWYRFQGKSGLLKWRFPQRATVRSFVKLNEWRNAEPKFLFDPSKLNIAPHAGLHTLEWRFRQMQEGNFQYFSSQWFAMPDWHTHPLTGYSYPRHLHWSRIEDFSDKGDIKFIWEKSRFTFLYDLVRHDYHFHADQSDFALRLMADWIEQNPVNSGPNWKCGQEISLRVLNWTFALHYFRRSEALNQPLLDRILCSIYDQISHVAANIRFSQIAVRNNHVLTEAAALFTVGLMFPYFSKHWLDIGKVLFEKEIIAQIAADGTYLQFSMNYHRVAVQLLTWAIKLAEANDIRFAEPVYDRAEASLRFLQTCMDDSTGFLPQYGHQDGALFFPLTECDFRDFRPQLLALQALLNFNTIAPPHCLEEQEWLAGRSLRASEDSWPVVGDGAFSFSNGGYYVIRDAGTLTFLRCGSYDSRPFQADHNHLDIWVNGRNILRDAGTWLYNADPESLRDFAGTRGHNTVMLGNFDQMQKHHRFIWTHWITHARGTCSQDSCAYWIEAEFAGFRHVASGIVHRRRVVKAASRLHWLVEDQVSNVPPGLRMRQLWHPDAQFLQDFRLTAVDGKGHLLAMQTEPGWYSGQYGLKTSAPVLVFETEVGSIRTVIEKI